MGQKGLQPTWALLSMDNGWYLDQGIAAALAG